MNHFNFQIRCKTISLFSLSSPTPVSTHWRLCMACILLPSICQHPRLSIAQPLLVLGFFFLIYIYIYIYIYMSQTTTKYFGVFLGTKLDIKKQILIFQKIFPSKNILHWNKCILNFHVTIYVKRHIVRGVRTKEKGSAYYSHFIQYVFMQCSWRSYACLVKTVIVNLKNKNKNLHIFIFCTGMQSSYEATKYRETLF